MGKPESVNPASSFGMRVGQKSQHCAMCWQSSSYPTTTPRPASREVATSASAKWSVQSKSNYKAPSALGRACAWWLPHSSENIVGWGQDGPGNHCKWPCTIGGASQTQGTTSPPLFTCASDNTTSGPHRPKMLLLSSHLPSVCIAGFHMKGHKPPQQVRDHLRHSRVTTKLVLPPAVHCTAAQLPLQRGFQVKTE